MQLDFGMSSNFCCVSIKMNIICMLFDDDDDDTQFKMRIITEKKI